MDCLCRPSRIMTVRINLLDETDYIHEIKDDLPGQALLDVVFARLNLIETSYFGIRYIDEENQTHWLDPASRISRQLKPKPDPYDLYFGVKFYAADPCKLLEEITRYQLFLQVKQDVLQGRLPVAFELAAELGAFVVQSELGDYDQRRHSKGYVSEFRLLPNQSNELETRVAELHQQLKGMSPASAELNYLDKVKWHDMYGVDLHPVLGEDSVEYFLGLTPSGIVVLRNKTTVAHYYWPRIAKVYYKGRYFMLRISDKNNELSTYGFETPRKAACKHLWRCCVEHHAFFRSMRSSAPLPTSQSNASDLFQLGSRLKYGGRSEKQSKDALSIGRLPPAFTRVPSKRQPRRLIDDFLNGGKNSGGAGVGNGYGNGNGLATLEKASNMSTNFESPYRSTYSIPTSLGINPYHQQTPYGHNASSYNSNGVGAGGGGGAGSSNLQTPDSPRSTRSAPWPRSQQRSLFGHKPSSPRSVRSAGKPVGAHQHHHHHHHQRQQPQVPSQPQQREQQQQQQRYRSSSVESHSSNDSRSTRRHKQRHRRTSDNESELSRGSARSGPSHHRKHRRSRHRRDSGGGSDHGSTRGRSYSGHRSTSARSGSAELIDSTSQWREVQRRQAEASLGQSSVQQASVSKSSMVARSLHSNDSHSDTHSHHRSRRHRKNKSPSESRNRIWSSELARHLQFGLVETAGMTEDQLREIPYTVVETNSKRTNSNLKIHKSGSKSSVGGKSNGSGNTITNGSGSASGQGKNRVDRIRGLYFQNSHPNDSTGTKNGSIRSASTISSRECERNNGLVRMMSSMSMGDFISPTGSNLSPLENSALRVSHEHTDSGLGADQDYAYSSERSSDSTRYGTNQSSGASSGSHRKSTYNSLMQQTVSNQQQLQQQQQQQQQQPQSQRQNSFYAPQRQSTQKQNYPKTNQSNPSKSLAPIHNAHSSSTTNNANNTTNPNPGNGNGNANASAESGNRLLNYTTFENNQYKFSLNNAFGKARPGNGNGSGVGAGAGSFVAGKPRSSIVEWPSTPAAPYYYNGPPSTSVHAKRRDAKSDIGVPTRRLSGQAITKTQLLSGQLPSASCYPMPTPACASIGLDSRLQPAKSDLFLSYMQSSSSAEYERPYIYNYKMPQMPEFLRPAAVAAAGAPQRPQPPPPKQQQSNTAYHISGAQAADPPPLYKPTSCGGGSGGVAGAGAAGAMLYGGATPATDVMYYQFDNGKPPIVQQPKSGVVGPLLYLQHGQNVAPSNATAAQPTCTNSNTTTTNSSSHPHSPCSEDDIDELDEEQQQHINAEASADAAITPMSPNNNSQQLTTSPTQATATTTTIYSAAACANISAFDSINLDNCNANLNVLESQNNYTKSSSAATANPTHNNPSVNCNALNANTLNRSPHRHQRPRHQHNHHNQNQNQMPNLNSHASPNQNRNLNQNQNLNQLQHANSQSNSNRAPNSSSLQNQNPNISSSLEIILSPIIQSSRRAQ